MDSSIRGIGCDIVSVSRIARLISDERFLNMVYTAYEQQYIRQKGAQTGAGLWAAKEAASKALGTGFAGFTARDIEIRHSADGAPQISLHNGAQAAAASIGAERIHLSISHEREQAMAFVVIA